MFFFSQLQIKIKTVSFKSDFDLDKINLCFLHVCASTNCVSTNEYEIVRPDVNCVNDKKY